MRNRKRKNNRIMVTFLAGSVAVLMGIFAITISNAAEEEADAVIKQADAFIESHSRKYEREIPSHEEIIELETYEAPEELGLFDFMKANGFSDWEAYNIIGWMQGEADYSQDLLLGWYSANAIMNSLEAGIEPSIWGEHYSFEAMVYRTECEEILFSTDYCIREAIADRNRNIKACYGLYCGAGEGEPIYVSYAVTQEGEPTAVWSY